jgi:hypothetical protein
MTRYYYVEEEEMSEAICSEDKLNFTKGSQCRLIILVTTRWMPWVSAP